MQIKKHIKYNYFILNLKRALKRIYKIKTGNLKNNLSFIHVRLLKEILMQFSQHSLGLQSLIPCGKVCLRQFIKEANFMLQAKFFSII